MSSPAVLCYQCGENPGGVGGLCVTCQDEIASFQQLKSSTKDRQSQANMTSTLWKTDTQAAKLAGKSHATFKKGSDDVAGCIAKFAKDYVNADKTTSFNGQTTIHDYGDTVTVDFQGIRKGGNTFWIDVQGQVGKGNNRDSYFQVMIECCGTLPDNDTLEAAILKSLGTKFRSVLHRQNTKDRPNTSG